MHKQESALNGLLQQRLLPLYYNDDALVSIRILEALYEAGIRLVEYTNRGANALTNFTAMKKAAEQNMKDVQLGIGTIKNAEQARSYIDAGADFIVCPTTNAAVGKVTAAAELLWIPGCMTPTEIAEAEAAGAKLVKIFPGNVLGPSFITAVKDLFPGMLFMPTGGVETTNENLKAWFDAGVCAVGMGSKLVSAALVKEKNYAKITQLTKEALSAIPHI
ncbi:MAG TPA: bifunctional 4-hydroxy-2-oxoglutarate aldolase/2-dehydro-3-deoxy-phosphogluconate aldolase [Chitinophagaceae bacterium]|nr:bifunctional 4-hydroxy-2-oxoglutarate aldolase/2-dehydro-3-deoxy-phosphogluconate aldolase [Chitinophagaceae bacterium]